MENFTSLIKIILSVLVVASITTHIIAGCTLPDLASAQSKFDANKYAYINNIQPLDLSSILLKTPKVKRNFTYRICSIETGYWIGRWWHPWSNYKKISLYLAETEDGNDTYFYLGSGDWGNINFVQLNSFNRLTSIIRPAIQFDECQSIDF